jgi:hypothetical protein
MLGMQKTAALAIPSPGRRESGNWILPTVPLVPPHDIAAESRAADGSR